MDGQATFAGTTLAVLGANGGIGQAVVRLATDQGATVIAGARRWSASGSPADGRKAETLEVDPCDEYSMRQAVLQIAQDHSELDAIVYCVGDIHVAKVSELALSDWMRIFSANLTGAFLTAKHGIPLLKPEGSLTFVGAVSERLQLPGMAAYAASKAALETFAVTLAKEERKCKVSVLRPGAVDTPFWHKVPLRLPKNALTPEAVAARIAGVIANQESGIIDL